MRNYYNIDFNTSTVSMTCWDSTNKQDVTVAFDLDDLKKVDATTNRKWYVARTSPTNPGCYVYTTSQSKTIYLHWLINATPIGMETHHWDDNPLNNKKDNLIAVTPAKHRYLDQCKGHVSRNKPAGRNNKTGVRGVTLTKAGKYRAQYAGNTLGYFDDLESARICTEQFREWLTAFRTNAYSA